MMDEEINMAMEEKFKAQDDSRSDPFLIKTGTPNSRVLGRGRGMDRCSNFKADLLK